MYGELAELGFLIFSFNYLFPIRFRAHQFFLYSLISLQLLGLCWKAAGVREVRRRTYQSTFELGIHSVNHAPSANYTLERERERILKTLKHNGDLSLSPDHQAPEASEGSG